MDTLQKVRKIGNDSYSYAVDCQNITALKKFSDSHNVAILVVHHTRKMEATDSFDMISGTNGLPGTAEGALTDHFTRSRSTSGRTAKRLRRIR